MERKQIRKLPARWLIFCIVIGLLAGAVKCAQVAKLGLADSDYYWHCTLGRDILEAGGITDTDTYSWLSEEAGYKETAHSWLGSVIVYLFSTIFEGENGPVLGALFFIYVTTALLGFLIVYLFGFPFDISNPECDFLNCATGLLGLGACMTYMLARPLNFGLILFLLSMHLLQDAYSRPDSKKWLLLPVVSILWGNLHGGSVPILFAFNFLFFVLSFVPKFSFFGIEQEEGFSKQRTLRMLAAGVLDVFAALLNPYSYKLFIYFFVTNSEVTKERVSEWQPVALANIAVIVPLVILIAAFLPTAKRKVRLSYLLPVLCCLVMSAKYARIVSYLILVSVIFAYREISDLAGDYVPNKLNKSRIGKLTAMLAVCAVFFTCASYMLVGDMRSQLKENGLEFEPELTEHLKNAGYDRLYSGYNYGGILIYNGFQSFIDSRADPYPDDVLSRAMEFEKGENFSSDEFRDYVEEYAFDGALVPCGSHLDCVFSLFSDWNLAYSDDIYRVYARK